MHRRAGLLALALLFAFPLSVTAQANLVANPGFEDGPGDGWESCGTVSFPDATASETTNRMVHSGRFAARISPDGTRCNFSERGILTKSVTIPDNVDELTISFWYSRIGNPGSRFRVQLNGFSGPSLPLIDPSTFTGWHLYRAVLFSEDVEALKGKTVDLTFEINALLFPSAIPPDEPLPGVYIDDVRIVAEDESPADSPIPSELASDGRAPIVYVDAELGGVARMQTDGTGRQLVPGVPDGGILPVWASGGDRIATVRTSTQGSLTNPEVNPASISVIEAVPAGGGAAVELYRTLGDPGFDPITSPGPARPALDVVVRSIDWSPDDTQLVLGVCSRTRTRSGSASDEICEVRIVDVATGEVAGVAKPGFRSNWSSTGQILFEETLGLNDRDNGIWSVLPNALDAPTLLVESVMGGQFNLSRYVATWATWAPDGTRFATVRDIDGGRRTQTLIGPDYLPPEEIALVSASGEVLDPLIVVDHGVMPSGLSWSPDGAFILYTLFEADGEGTDIWWLRVSDGLTGRLTTNSLSAGGDWSATVQAVPASEAPSGDASSMSVYPSPTQGPVTVALDLAPSTRVQLRVVDALGREVARLHDGLAASGGVQVSADLRHLPAGVYTVLAQSGASIQTRRVVVTR